MGIDDLLCGFLGLQGEIPGNPKLPIGRDSFLKIIRPSLGWFQLPATQSKRFGSFREFPPAIKHKIMVEADYAC
jgi:hypothetical protein